MIQVSSDAIRLSINETKIKATAIGIIIGIGNRIKIGGSQSWESYWNLINAIWSENKIAFQTEDGGDYIIQE